MKIYFAWSIRWGRELQDTYMAMIIHLRQYGEVLTEHVGDQYLSALWEKMSSREIHDRDIAWIVEADVVIADVTVTSLGVGYELGRAVELHKPILCLYKSEAGKSLSAMIDWSPSIVVKEYMNLEEANSAMTEFLQTI